MHATKTISSGEGGVVLVKNRNFFGVVWGGAEKIKLDQIKTCHYFAHIVFKGSVV